MNKGFIGCRFAGREQVIAISVSTALAMIGLVLLPVASSVADRWERADVIVPSLGVTAVSLSVIGLATETKVFIFGSLLLGFSSASPRRLPARRRLPTRQRSAPRRTEDWSWCLQDGR